MIIEGMATNGAEPTYCMGDDIPLPVLSSRPHHLGDYFKQRFAQVSSPHPDCLCQPCCHAQVCFLTGNILSRQPLSALCHLSRQINLP